MDRKYYKNNSFTSTLYFFSLSISGLIILTLILKTSHFTQPPNKVVQNLFLLLFAIICVMGIFAGLFPSSCKNLRISKNNPYQKEISENKEFNNFKMEGHHPNCENFSDHIFHFKGNTYCAGCTGLVTGGLISLILVTIGFTRIIPLNYFNIIYWAGLITQTITLTYFMTIRHARNILKIFFNIIFVVSYCLIFISVIMAYNNIFLYFYVTVLLLVVILTRTSISRYKHKLICYYCSLKECNIPFH